MIDALNTADPKTKEDAACALLEARKYNLRTRWDPHYVTLPY